MVDDRRNTSELITVLEHHDASLRLNAAISLAHREKAL